MRKLGGGGFGRVCRDFLQQSTTRDGKAAGCAFGASCRFLHPGTFQVQSVYHTLPLNWPPVPHVGRLDVATEGLLLFTDDGQLQSALLEKDGDGGSQRAGVKRSGGRDVGGLTTTTNVKKVYLVQVSREEEMKRQAGLEEITGNSDTDSEPISECRKPQVAEFNGSVVSSAMLDSLRQPLVYQEDGIVTKPAQAHLVDGSEMRKLFRAFPRRYRTPCEAAAHSLSKVSSDRTAWVRVQIEEGRNRQVRRLCARAGLAVHRLIRWGFGPITLHDLKGASAAALTSEQVMKCQKCCGLGSTVVLPMDRPTFRVGGNKAQARTLKFKRKASEATSEGSADLAALKKKKKNGEDDVGVLDATSKNVLLPRSILTKSRHRGRVYLPFFCCCEEPSCVRTLGGAQLLLTLKIKAQILRPQKSLITVIEP